MQPDSFYLALAAEEASKFIGATAPNPPVGACLVKNDKLLSIGAHMRAGKDHAEVVALRRAIEVHGKKSLVAATLFVTLEPCDHSGKTPPCTHSLIEAGIKKVVIGARDPNKKVSGNGLEKLKAAGIDVVLANHPASEDLIRPFAKIVETGIPWVVHKQAFRMTFEGEFSMFPERGKKTFTSLESLVLAHRERKSCDAIITGINTVISDQPEFTVRHIRDFSDRQRHLVVLSSKGTMPPEAWLTRQKELGFKVSLMRDIRQALAWLGEQKVLRVLVEAGPTLSDYVQKNKLWDERLVFFHRINVDAEAQDTNFREFACSQE